MVYDLSTSAQNNQILSSTASLNLDLPFAPNTTTLIELKLASQHFGIIGINDFVNGLHPDGSYIFYFF